MVFGKQMWKDFSGKWYRGIPYRVPPKIDRAIIRLAAGNKLEIEADKQNGECNCVNMVEFNGQKIMDYRVSVQSLINGGKLKVQLIWKK